MATEIVQPSQRQVKIDGTVGQAPYSASFDNAALHETLLGQLGSTIAQNAANSLSTKMGYEEGMNPHGDLLPPITEADKHYQQSYLAQSKNVLSLQLNKMVGDAQTELSKSYRITPEMIADFQHQVTQGTSEVLQNAPMAVKQELGIQYANSIISTTQALNRRMIAQNKEEAISRMKVADKNTDTAILDNAAMGKEDLAKELYEQKMQQNKRQRSSGMMTPLEESTSNTAAKLSYYSGISNSRAIEARNKKGDALGKYLAGFADPKNKPSDLSFSEWNTIGSNTLSLMRHMDSLQQTDKNLIMSDLNEKMAMNELTEQDILTAYESPSVNRTDINELLTRLYKSKHKASTKEHKIQELTTNFTNAQAFGEASGGTVNDTYSNLVQAVKEKNPNLSPMEAEASIASMAGGSIPRFLNTISNLSKSNNIDDVQAASNAYHRVQSVAPQNVIGIPEQAYNFINAFDSFKQVNPGDPQTALAQTRNALLARPKEEKEAIKANWDAYYRKQYSTPEQRNAFARQVLGVNTLFNSTNIQNKAVANDHIMNLFEKYTLLSGGDIETAKSMTEQAVKNIYGDTWVNGRHEIAYLSLEKVTGLEEGSTFFIQKDIASQVQKSFAQFKEAYDKGNNDYYYRLKNPEKYSIETLKQQSLRNTQISSELGSIEERINSISKEGYFAGMNHETEYQNLLSKRSALESERKTINKSLKGIDSEKGGIEIEKVWRGSKTSIPIQPKIDIIKPGNIDLLHRPIYNRADGGIETVFSTSVNFDGKEVLIPQIDMQGKKLTTQEAIDEYKKTGNHLGIFKNSEDATTYAKWLHKQQEAIYSNDGEVQSLHLAVVPETNTTLSYDNAQPVIGNYFVKLLGPSGGIENLDTTFGYKTAPLYYSPNIAQIRQDYAAFHNRFGALPSYKEQLSEYLRSKKVVQ